MQPVSDAAIPSRFTDPFTFELMVDPVVCDDGLTYDRSTVEKAPKSGITRTPLQPLVDNLQLRSELFEAFPDQARAYRERQILPALRPPSLDTSLSANPFSSRPSTPRSPSTSSLGSEDIPMHYDGEWRNHMRHGYATERSLSGWIYEGYYKKDVRHGQGRLRTRDGIEYLGMFKNDKFHGPGTMRLPNGDRIEARFKNGLHVEGTYFWTNGDVYKGSLLNYGKGIVLEADGTSYPAQQNGRKFRRLPQFDSKPAGFWSRMFESLVCLTGQSGVLPGEPQVQAVAWGEPLPTLCQGHASRH